MTSTAYVLTEENVDAVRRPLTAVEKREAEILSILKPGDCLIYWTPCIADVIIGIKTWSRRAAHIEIYEGQALCEYAPQLLKTGNFAWSRTGQGIHVSSAARAEGVNYYPLRFEGLQYIRRPLCIPEWAESRDYFAKYCQGNKYAWESLLSFAVAHAIKSPRRMFCSDYATRRYRAAGCVPFDKDYASQLVPPDYYLVSPSFTTPYNAANLRMRGNGFYK